MPTTNNLPELDQLRPNADARSTREVAELLGVTYGWVRHWTAPPRPRSRARGLVLPSWGEPERQGDPAWFAPQDVMLLRYLYLQQRHLEHITSSRSALEQAADAAVRAPRPARGLDLPPAGVLP